MRCANRVSRSSRTLRHVALAVLAVLCIAAVGCNSWFAQDEVARESGARLVVPVLTSIDPIDESEQEYASANDVTAKDLQNIPADYIIGPNDMLSISVYDLVGPGGMETTKMARVSGTGYISLPMLPDPVKASGLTEFELVRAIVDAYDKANVLKNARVSVNVVEPRQWTFSILGAIQKPGQYVITEIDFRLLNALVLAGGTTSPTEYLYVIRKIKSETPTTRPAGATPTGPTMPSLEPTSRPAPPDLAPRGMGPLMVMPMLALADTPARPTTAPVVPMPVRDEGPLVNIGGQTRTLTPSTQPVVPPAPAPRTTAMPGTAEATTQPAFEFGAGAGLEDTRVIRVPLQLLKSGDLRYNIVVRPSDLITIPEPTIGYYYVGGHASAPGAYNMTGQKITLKQAIISARMLDSLAVPARTDVIRRVGNNEVFVRVNLYSIFEGRQPDLYLKPSDTIVIGTDWYPPFLQAVRGAFRLTYGFGFLYDRNYAPVQRGLTSTTTGR